VNRAFIPLLLSVALLGCADARHSRSGYARAAFVKTHPCPATGAARGPCPGYIVDHIEPLCAGGPDAPANMQWQTRAEALKKDRIERALCRTRAQGRAAAG
jgi:hypothetical protein